MKELIDKRGALLERISKYKYILRGSIVKQGNICGTPNCICKRKKNPVLHGPYNYLSHRGRKRINMIFLNDKKYRYAKKGIEEYQELIDIIYSISEINFQLLRYHYRNLAEEV